MNIDLHWGGRRPFSRLFPLRIWVLLACSGALLVTLIGYNLLNNILPTSDDVDLYYKYARRTLQGEIPYLDFLVEYPPFAMVFLLLPALLCYPLGGLQPERYELLFHTECFLLTLGTLWLVYDLMLKLRPWLGFRRDFYWRMGAFTLAALLISLYLLQRFDIGPSFLTVTAVWLFYHKKPGWSGVLLGMATMAKLYPVIMLPLVLGYLWYSKKPLRSLIVYSGGFGLACAVVLLPFGFIGTQGLQAFVAYHSQRGIQLETIFAGIIVLASYFGMTDALSMVEYGALGLASPWVKPLASLSTLLTVSGLLVIYFLAWRVIRRDEKILRDPAWFINLLSLTVLWFILANKVLSPQYMVWLLPFVPFWRGQVKIVLFLIAMPLSFVSFPFLIDLISRLDVVPFLVLGLRNGLLIAIFYLLFRETFASLPFPRFKPDLSGLRPKLRLPEKEV